MNKIPKGVLSARLSYYDGRWTSANLAWRGDGAAERAGLENRSPGNWTASSNLAPSATQELIASYDRE